MTISTGARLLSGVVLFVVLARILGLEQFGRLTYCFSLASIITLLVEYGFTNKLLIDIGSKPHKIKKIMGSTLIVKAFLCGVLILTITLIQKFIFIDPLIQILLVATIFVSFGDFLNVAFRGVGLFHEETKIVIITSIIHFTIIVVIALVVGDIFAVAHGFVVSRSIYLFVCWRGYHRVLGGFCFPENKLSCIYRTLKSGYVFALDSWLVNLILHIDKIIINYFLGSAAVGLYQAGMNIVRGLERLGPVLANVFLPKLAKYKSNISQFNILARKLQTELLLIGFLFFCFMIFGRDKIPTLIYGSQFSGLTELFPYFSLFLLLRYAAISQGILLTASSLQRMRVWGLLIGLFIILSIPPMLIDAVGLLGMVLSQLAVVLVLTFYYSLVLKWKKIPTGASYVSLLVLICSIFIFVLSMENEMYRSLFYFLEEIGFENSSNWWLGLWKLR